METWNVFHAEDDKPQGSCGNDRYTMAKGVYFNNMGDSPYFEQAMHLSLEQTAPSADVTLDTHEDRASMSSVIATDSLGFETQPHK